MDRPSHRGRHSGDGGVSSRADRSVRRPAEPRVATRAGRLREERGQEGALRVGDEFTIRIPGPWDGPVRVIETDDAGFGFVTRDGHLEAGRIHFSARDLGDARLEVRIESWARGGDHVSNVLFDWIGINKEVQLHMWTSVLTRLTQMCEGRRDGPVVATTRRLAPDELARSARVTKDSSSSHRATAAERR